MSEPEVEYLIVWKHKDTGRWDIAVHETVDEARTVISLMIAMGHKAAGITFRHQAEPSAIVEIATHA